MEERLDHEADTSTSNRTFHANEPSLLIDSEMPDAQNVNPSFHTISDNPVSVRPWYADSKYRRYWKHYQKMQDWFGKHHLFLNDRMRYQSPSWYYQSWDRTTSQVYQYYYAMWFNQWIYGAQQMKPIYPTTHLMAPPNLTTQRQIKRKRNRSFSNMKEKKRRDKRRSHEKLTMRKTKKGENGDIQNEDEEEFELEITDDLLEFFAQSAKHRKERDERRKENGNDQSYVMLGEVFSLPKRITNQPPSERPGVKRTAEMKALYGKGAAMIHGMETAMQLTFDRNCDIMQPKLWPYLPLNIKFND